MMPGDDRMACAACGARIAGQERLAWLSLAVTAVALVALLQTRSAWWVPAVLLGVAERYVAARLAVDRALFAHLAREGDLAQLDAALVTLGMIDPARGGRPLADRLAGVRAWLQRHTWITCAQLAAAALALGAH
jgi:hypothetical protein